MILAYSAIKIKANPRLPYSILNPDTSSDSPSAKSKGVRFVSAKHEISQIPTKGIKIKIFLNSRFIFIRINILKEFLKIKKNIRIKAKLTS